MMSDSQIKPRVISVQSESEFLREIFTAGAVILIISVIGSVTATWLTTMNRPPEVLYPALWKSFLFPWLIVPICITVVARISLRNRRRILDLMTLAMTDEMTGLANRRAFMNEASRLLEAAGPDNDSLCILILDIDHFKKINDTYGHDVGDMALIHTARQIEKAAPKDALVARLGGEEFAILLAFSDLKTVEKQAERIREAVALSPARAASQLISITASIGVSVVSPGDKISAALSVADTALYEAKSAGRNCSVIAA